MVMDVQKRKSPIHGAKAIKPDKLPKPDDAADGLALAICHAHSSKLSYMSK